MIRASANELTRSGEVLTRGAFHSTQNSGNFGWYIKWNGPFRFVPTGIFGTSFEGGPPWPVWSFRSVGRTEKKVCEIKLQLYESPWESAYYLSETCRRFLTKAIYQLSWNDYNKAWLNTNWLKHRIHLPYSSRNCFESFEYRKIPKISSSMYKPLQI